MNRPARVAPQFSTDDLLVTAPPCTPSNGGISRLAPVLGLGAMVAVGALIWGSGMASRGPTAVMLPAMMLVSAVGTAIHVGSRRSGGSIDQQRKRYLGALGRLSEQLSDTAHRQRDSLLWTHPAPSSLWTLIGGQRMWERGGTDSDFCHVRVGLGRQRLARRIVVPAVAPVDDLDPVTADALRRLVHCHTTIAEAPIAIALRGVGVLLVDGGDGGVRALVRAIICQLAVLHGPDDVGIAAVVGDGRRAQWDWLKWLPHNACPQRGDPMVYESGASIAAQRRHMVVIVDGAEHRHCARAGMTLIAVGHRGDDTGALRLHVDNGRLGVRSGRHIEDFATADGLTMVQARLCARRLAHYRRPDPAPDDLQRWLTALTANMRAPLQVPLGITTDGDTVDLDIKEAADGGHGPHGLCVGATGSGKSELLRTVVGGGVAPPTAPQNKNVVVEGMIARHSSNEINLVLIDFKGGATFLGLERVNHVSAVITNLADEAHLVARAKEALGGEIHRRQTLLRRAGNAVNLTSYRRRREVDPALPVLPTLFIVVDEFAELLAQQPDFAELFTMIGRVGRSLGVHLLLASQRLDEGRLRGLESHLSYRICMKTATAAESRAVLGVPDAGELPATPGAALLRTGDGRLVRFHGTYLGARARNVRAPAPANPAVRLFTSRPDAPPATCDDGAPTALDVIVAQAGGRGSPAHQVWLPPLARSPDLSELNTVGGAELSATIGLIDRPFEQRRAPLVVELGGARGNVAIVGAPQSGKSTAVCTLIMALASWHTPRRLQFYGLDFGGGSLEGLRDLPHVGSVASRQERELVRRIVGHVGAVLSNRESRCRADEYGDVVLVVDGWSTVRDEFPDLEATITGHAARGLSFGIHVIVTAGRWADVRPSLKDQVGTRIELRLGDPVDSDIDRKQASMVPIGNPGRGITRDGYHFLIATPEGAQVDRSASWRAPPVRLLPGLIEHATVIDQARDGAARTLLGLGEDHLEPVGLDFDRQQHLLILGDGECGKTATLRTVCGEILRGRPIRPAALFVIDYRRSLIGLAGSERVVGYAFSGSSLAEQLPELMALLQGRLPAAGTSVEQLKARSWWAGPEVFVVIDDYDVVTATTPEVLTPLLALLPHAADLGLHLVVARRCAGAARAMYEPLLAHLRDNGCAGLLLSGSPEEGGLIGHHRASAQPPGRGLLVTRTTAQLVQIGWCPP
jgi:S-DNA-T family DNA segregation ATPase FtsK/SpoIIIE